MNHIHINLTDQCTYTCRFVKKKQKKKLSRNQMESMIVQIILYMILASKTFYLISFFFIVFS